jgi:phosphoenolpyruvate carboxykinase (GTP)
MSDYFQHWLDLGALLDKSGAALPKIFCVNWFRKGPDGKFVWPGYGENMRVLKWIVERVEGHAEGALNAFGLTPRYDDLDWAGLDVDRARYAQVSSVEASSWADELALHDELFHQLAHHLPAALPEVRQRLAARFGA